MLFLYSNKKHIKDCYEEDIETLKKDHDTLKYLVTASL